MTGSAFSDDYYMPLVMW